VGHFWSPLVADDWQRKISVVICEKELAISQWGLRICKDVFVSVWCTIVHHWSKLAELAADFFDGYTRSRHDYP